MGKVKSKWWWVVIRVFLIDFVLGMFLFKVGLLSNFKFFIFMKDGVFFLNGWMEFFYFKV